MSGKISKFSNPVVIRDVDCKGVDVVALVKHTIDKKCASFVIRKDEDEHFIISAVFKAELRNKEVDLSLEINYDENTIYYIILDINQADDAQVDYTTDLKIFYYENLNIYESIQEIREENETPKTVRVYKLMYNEHPIYGTYTINLKKCNVKFHTINIVERDEPLTEHVVAFDVKVKAKTIQDARGKAYNIATEFADYLSVLLDVSFFEPQSIYRNFVRMTKDRLAQRVITHERYRTSFIDNELGLVVKDNLNGLATIKDVQKGINFDCGVISISNPNDSNVRLIEKYGNTEHIEEIFEKHRLEKVEEKTKPLYSDYISEEVFILGQNIHIPKCIRSYYRGIDDLPPEIRKAFRNAARLYNKSSILGMDESSFQISLLVASVETLAKQEMLSYSDFVKKYNPNAKKSDIDDMYEIRSKLFHSGEFSFFEYDVNMNPYVNPVYEYFADKYTEFRRILRKTIINWIKINITEKKSE